MRTVEKDGAPWFLAKDVCAALGMTDVSNAVEKLDGDEKSRISVSALNAGTGAPNSPPVLVISESGLYALVLRCRDAMTPGSVAHRFRKWVTDDEALDLVFSKNFARRHLDESQRSMVSARWSQMMAERAAKEGANFGTDLSRKSGRGRPRKSINSHDADKAAAKAANVSEGSTRKARKVLDKGTRRDKSANLQTSAANPSANLQ